MLIVSIIASANVFVYYPASLTASPVEPPLVLLDPNVTDVVADIGPNQTSADVVIFGSNFADLVKNPDIYSSADQWYAQPGNYLDVYWTVDSAGGSSGGTLEIYGTVPGSLFSIITDSAYVVQPIHTPPAAILSANMTVRYRLATLTGLAVATYIFGLWDIAGNGWAWYTTGSLSTSSTYTEQTFTVTNISADKDYLVVGGIIVSTLITRSTVDYYIDYMQLTVQTAEYTFSNTVLDLNVTSGDPYYVRLTVTGLDTQPDLDCNITLSNLTAYRSEPIRIVNGSVVVSATSEILLTQPPNTLYVSGSVDVSMVKSVAENSTINLTLTYCTLPGGEGACVSYPITLIIDPPALRTTYYVERHEVGSAPPAAMSELLRIDPDEVRPLLKRGGG